MARQTSSRVSITRRRLMLAAAAGAAAPGTLLAAQCGGGELGAAQDAFAAGSAGQTLVLSGRVLGSGCQPLAGAVIEVWHGGAEAARATSDGDGRFLLATRVPAAGQLAYSVTHPAHDLRTRALHFARAGSHAAESVARVERDAAGVWRAAAAIALA